MRIIMWFLLSCKRQLKHAFFVIMLVLLPLLLFSVSQMEEQDSGKIRIGVFSEDQDIVPEIMDSLLAQDGMFEFYICDSEQMLKDDVAARRAECGYVFADGFREKLDKRRFKRSIQVYAAPSTIMHGLSKEVVFASVIEVYGVDILEQFLTENDVFADLNQEPLWQELQEHYALQFTNGSTFSFRYETLSMHPIDAGVARIAFPIRGVLAVYLMVVGMFSAVSLIKDEWRGLFITQPFGSRFSCKLAVLAAPVCLAGISAMVTLIITSNFLNPGRELGILLVYLCLIVAFAYVLKLLIKDPVLLCSLIPVFILASLVICPVFIDISQWLPSLKPIRYLLLPYYYIRAF